MPTAELVDGGPGEVTDRAIAEIARDMAKAGEEEPFVILVEDGRSQVAIIRVRLLQDAAISKHVLWQRPEQPRPLDFPIVVLGLGAEKVFKLTVAQTSTGGVVN